MRANGHCESSKLGSDQRRSSPVWKRATPCNSVIGTRSFARSKTWAHAGSATADIAIRTSLRMDHLGGAECESQHSDVVFLAKCLSGLSDSGRTGVAELKCALEAEQLAGGVARFHNAVGD